MQLLAYGGTKPIPYQRGICESQALEPGVTGNFTIDAMTALANSIGCNSTSVHSPETVTCLRQLDTQTLFNASFNTYVGDIAHNIGDIWLPSVDGDFLPAPPSQLVQEGRFGNAQYKIGWTDGDVNFFTNFSIATEADTYNFIQTYLPAMPRDAVNELLQLYPVEEFIPPPTTNLTAEFYRSARVFRDVLMVCQPLYLAEGIHKKSYDANHFDVHLYDFNQTILDPILASVYNISDLGVVHTSEFAYIYGNLSHYNISGWPFNPTKSDYNLLERASHSWSHFATYGSPSSNGYHATTFKGWKPAFIGDKGPYVFVAGGENEGLTALDGYGASAEMKRQRLRERCALINSPRFIGYLQY
jgi:carboxylesterase type B